MPYVRAGEENSGRIEIYYEDHGRGRRRWARSASETPGIRDRLAARKPGAVFADAPVPGSKDPGRPGPAAAPGVRARVAETMALADRLGIGHRQLAEVIEGGPLDAPIADRQPPQHGPARPCAGVSPWSGR